MLAGKHPYVLYYLAAAMRPRMLMTVDGEGKLLPVSVRVGQAIDTVAQVRSIARLTCMPVIGLRDVFAVDCKWRGQASACVRAHWPGHRHSRTGAQPCYLGMRLAHAFVGMIADDHVSHLGQIIDPFAQAVGSTTLT